MKTTLKKALAVTVLSLMSMTTNAAIVNLACGANTLSGQKNVGTDVRLAINLNTLKAKGSFEQIGYTSPSVVNSTFYQDLSVKELSTSLKVTIENKQLKVDVELSKNDLEEIVLGNKTTFQGNIQALKGPIIPLAETLHCRVEKAGFQVGGVSSGVDKKIVDFLASLNLPEEQGSAHTISRKSYTSENFSLLCLHTDAHTSKYGSFGPSTICNFSHPAVKPVEGQFSWTLNGEEARDLQRVLGVDHVSFALVPATMNAELAKLTKYSIDCSDSDRCVILAK